MKLHEAIAYAIDRDGLEVIRDRRLLSYLADLQAYETPAVRNIIATIINEGCCDKLYKGLVKGSYQLAFNEVSYQLTHMLGFQEGIVKSVLDSVLIATRRTSAKPSIKNKKPLKPKPKVEREKVEKKNEDTINGHEFVDLGLSVKWATCNVGASSPSGYGNYYAWGETKPKSSYDEDNSVTYGKNLGDIAGDSRYDAARANWGGKWRMPTAKECEELVENSTWTCTSLKGTNGYRVISRKNGNSIFLPMEGTRRGPCLYSPGKSGRYWSSTPCGNKTHAYILDYITGYPHHMSGFACYEGHAVRPVSDKSYVP